MNFSGLNEAKSAGCTPNVHPKIPGLPISNKLEGEHTAPIPPRTLTVAILASFAFVVAIWGGSSHPDVFQLVLLRPSAALFLAPALYYLTREELFGARPLVALMLALGGLMLMQLVPLPPDLWMSLPGRSDLVALEHALGLDPGWRPLSWSPARTLNALASLVVPIVALLVALSIRASRSMLFHTILGIALFDSLLKFVQIASGADRSYYLYSSSRGYADGLFANENHSGVFSALAILLCARLAIREIRRTRLNIRVMIYAAGGVLFLASIMISGSRAAFLCAALALFFSGFSLSNAIVGPIDWRGAMLWLVISLVVVALLGTLLIHGQSDNLSDTISQDSFEDMRWKIAPILLLMIEQNWTFGIGFGAFEEYYRIHEPTELLLPVFINQAHNDVGQFLLEGGIAGLGLLACIVYWIIFHCFRIFRQGRRERWRIFYWLGVITIICAASTVDYPLRTPIFQVMSVWLLLSLSKESHQPLSRAN